MYLFLLILPGGRWRRWGSHCLSIVHTLEGEKGGDRVEAYVLIARSITYGQRMQRVLQRGNIRASVYRVPRDISDSGCGYGVEVAPEWAQYALQLLQQAGLTPSRIYRKYQNQYQEVRL